MAIEMTGREFYRVTAEKTSDDQGRETFKFLATEEEKHFHLLQTWLLKGFLTRIRSSDRGKAFRDVCHEHWRTSCEKNSLEFYSKAAQDASDPAENEFLGTDRMGDPASPNACKGIGVAPRSLLDDEPLRSVLSLLLLPQCCPHVRSWRRRTGPERFHIKDVSVLAEHQGQTWR
jgi:hypothetical protein